MQQLLRRCAFAFAVIILAAPALRAQFVSPYAPEEGLPTAVQVAKDSIGSDVILTAYAAVVQSLAPFGTSTTNLQSGKGDGWVYNFYSPSTRKVIGVGVVNAPLLGGFRGSGEPGSIDSIDAEFRDTVVLDTVGAYVASSKIYDQIKNDPTFVAHQTQYPGFQPAFMGLGNKPGADIPISIDMNQAFWTVVWTGEGDSSMICFVGAKTGDEFCMRVGSPTSVPDSRSDAASASLAIAPNPANGTVRVSVATPATARVQGSELALFNERGDRVLDLTGSFAASGYQFAEFNAGALAAGVYFCRATGANWHGVTSVVIQK
jgi:hypothetical protein